MHILEIRIRGFLSYKDECVLKFDPGLNAIIGMNGSGKSNIVAALSFVFGDHLNIANKSNIQTGDNEQSTEVTVTLDNADSKFLQGKQQKVTLCRSLFRGKYSYQFNGKYVSKKEYRQILSSAGLHEQLNFYIVKQGMISQLSLESPAQRLNTLKDIAGHKTFEMKSLEAKDVLTECEIKKESIKSYMQHLEEGIKIVQNEHKRISEWQEIESQKIALQNRLKMFQSQEIKSELNLLNEQRDNKSDIVSEIGSNLTRIKEISDEIKTKINCLDSYISSKENLVKQFENELFYKVEELASIEREETETSRDEDLCNNNINELNVELFNLKNTIQRMIVEYKKAKESAENAERELNKITREDDRNSLYGDKKNVIERIEEMIKLASEEKKSQIETINHLKNEIKKVQSDVDYIQNDLNSFNSNSEADGKLSLHLKKMGEVMEKKRNLQNQITQIKNDIIQLKAEYQILSKRYGKAISYSNKSCVDIVKLWVNQCKISKTEFLGFIVDTFTCDPEFYKCIEQVARQKLFNVVVSSLDVAENLLSYVKAHRDLSESLDNNSKFSTFQGRLVIIIADILPQPKDNLKIPSECVRIIECIDYPENLKNVIFHLFGNTLLIPNVNMANKLTSEGYDCVTLEGEAFFSGGKIRIGFTLSDSLISLHKKVMHIEGNIENHEKSYLNLDSEIAEIDKVLCNMDTERVALMDEIKVFNNLKEKKVGEIMSLKSVLLAMEDKLRHAVTRGEKLDFQIGEWNKQISCLNSLSETKSADKAVYINDYVKKKQLNDEHFEYVSKKLHQLKLREKEISEEISITRKKSKIVNATDEIKNAINNITKRIEREELMIVEAKKKLFDIRSEINKQQSHEMDLRRNWTDEFSKMSQIDQKIASLNSRIDALKIDESTMNKEIEKMSKDQAIEKLRNVNNLLKEKTLANSTKLMTHYSSLLTQYVSLQNTYKSLTASNETIAIMLKKLDELKTDHFFEYLKKVNEKFQDIFNTLVPDGHVKLIFIPDGIGLDIQISFGNNIFEPIRRLSGGQKSLVSLALILSLQQMESCPFLIMDEIDAALDDIYRDKVSILLNKLSKKAYQVIYTTHWPKMLNFAERIFHVENTGGMSIVKIVEKDRAKYLVMK